jgi:hypothetical protein
MAPTPCSALEASCRGPYSNRSSSLQHGIECRRCIRTAIYVDLGGLMSYAYRNAEMFRAAATYVDKILKGAHPW